eukprot:TRINITY_DN4917_c0_g1_i1.p1 TRINITY_DN4917_c0_g1~~TRINITY_DN4917_c0_g1_i1.p1  ORF type:complete len:124 (+),score=2.45 TRINITY_DN4917_c0_g1_i1:184-555(+)
MRLPTNPTLDDDLLSLSPVNSTKPNWDTLLDSGSVYKLLYSLQILKRIIAPLEDTKNHSRDLIEERLAWRRKILLSGGFEHLYSVFIQGSLFKLSSTHTMSTLRITCLAMLLKLLTQIQLQAQ